MIGLKFDRVQKKIYTLYWTFCYTYMTYHDDEKVHIRDYIFKKKK